MSTTTEQILEKYPPNKKEGLLPILQEVQAEHGFLTDETLELVSRYLSIPMNKIFAVAAFYDQFRFNPAGHYHIQICRGTACHLYGSSSFLKEIEKQLKVKSGGTSRDKRFSLEVVNCMGACDRGPVVKINEQYHIRVNAGELTKIIRKLKEKTV